MITSTFDKDSSTLTLKLSSDLLSTNVEQASHALEGVFNSAPTYKKVVLDLLACKMVDSVGLNLLFSVMNRAKERGNEAKIIIPKGNLERIMQIAQLGKLFKVEVK